MDTATCVRGMETWCPPENTKLRASHVLPVLANIFCIKITEFVHQQNADILSCNYRLIMTQHNADKWMDCIWRLINSTHRAGSGGDPLPSLRRWTQLCVSQTLIIHVPLTPDKLFRAYSKSYTPCQRFILKKEKNEKLIELHHEHWTHFCLFDIPNIESKHSRHMTAFSHEKTPSLLFTAVMASALPKRNSLYTFETLLL